MSDWRCGSECCLWQFSGSLKFGGIPERMGACRGVLIREGSKCRYSLAAMEADFARQTAAIIARRKSEGEQE